MLIKFFSLGFFNCTGIGVTTCTGGFNLALDLRDGTLFTLAQGRTLRKHVWPLPFATWLNLLHLSLNTIVVVVV